MKQQETKLGFEVAETPVIYDVNGQIIESEDYKVIYRQDTLEQLHVAKSGYHLLLNEHFEETVERMLEISGFEFSGYSTLMNGGIIFAHLKNNVDNFAINGHAIKDYLMMGTSHNSYFPFFTGTTTEFVRCANQFSKINKAEKVRHTKSAPRRIEELMVTLKMFFDERKKLYNLFEKFNDTRISADTARLATEALFGITPEIKLEGKISTRKQNQIDLLNTRTESEMRDLGDNIWGWFNGVTRYSTHDLNNEGFGLIIGRGSKLNDAAFKISNEIFETGTVLF